MAFSSLSELRTARNSKLAKTDKLFRPDLVSELSRGEMGSLLEYCKLLRDITQNVTEDNVGDVTLPDTPFLSSLTKYIE